jgi:hypothetical protein
MYLALVRRSRKIIVHLLARPWRVKRRVSVVSADSRALAPHSLRERDLARCS